MKKLLALVLAMMLLFTVGLAAAETYKDAETGLSLEKPDGWTDDNSVDNAMLKFQIIAPDGKTSPTMIQYLCMDLFEYAGGASSGLSRDMLSDAFLSEELIKTALSSYKIISVEEKQLNGHKYMIYNFELSVSGVTATARGAVTLNNGYLFMFQFVSVENFDKYLPVFEDMLNSVSL